MWSLDISTAIVMGWSILLVMCFLGVALLASIENALMGVPQTRVDAARNANLRNAEHLPFWVESAGQVLATLQFLRLAFVVLATVAVLHLFAHENAHVSETLSVAMLICTLLVFGHLLPRFAAKKTPLTWSLASIRVVKFLTVCLWPVVRVLVMLSKTFAWISGFSAKEDKWIAFWTPDELANVTEEGRCEMLGKAGGDLYDSIIEFSDTLIREVMIPRTGMVTLPSDANEMEARKTAGASGHSRVPVYQDTIDNILGLLYVKDLSATLPLEREKSSDEAPSFELTKLLRPTFYVPEVMKISEVLREFQRRKTHMAIVVDEYGGTAGLVTLEDIIEEIVGEIQDEYDVEEKQYRLVGENKIIADGKVHLSDLEESMDVQFPSDGGYETLAGFITERAGFLPPSGTVVWWNEYMFTVKEASEKCIGTVEIERRPGAKEEHSPKH